MDNRLVYSMVNTHLRWYFLCESNQIEKIIATLIRESACIIFTGNCTLMVQISMVCPRSMHKLLSMLSTFKCSCIAKVIQSQSFVSKCLKVLIKWMEYWQKPNEVGFCHNKEKIKNYFF